MNRGPPDLGLTPPGDNPRERLIQAAIQEIERHGLSRLRVRSVAAAAGMNIASVNYHFRSKQALVAAALESSIKHLVRDMDAFLARWPEKPLAVLTELLDYLLEGGLRYPRIGKAHLYEAFVADDYTGPFPTRFVPVMSRLREVVCTAVPGLSTSLAGKRVVAALSAVFFPVFFGGLFRPFGRMDTAEERAHYVREVARHTLAPAQAPEPGSAGKRRGRTAVRHKRRSEG